MWSELVATLYPDHELHPPATATQLEAAESSLHVAAPAELRQLLLETNGVVGPLGLGLVWSIEQIVRDNLEFRSSADFRELYMPFDPLLFFADAGTGDQFAFRILDGAVRGADIYAWNHEDDSRTWVAPDLQRYLEWSADGRISI
jgi:hypothetical protein